MSLPWHTCYTQVPVYVNGTHPSPAGHSAVLSLSVSVAWSLADEASGAAGIAGTLWLPSVVARHCGEYFVYWLPRLEGADLCLRFCASSIEPPNFVAASYPFASPTVQPSPSYNGSSSDACYAYTAISDSTRRYTVGPGFRTDSLLARGWYRFIDDGFDFLVQTQTTSQGLCDAALALFVDGPHPVVAGDVVTAPVYAYSGDVGVDDGDPYSGQDVVRIQHCGSYFGE